MDADASFEHGVLPTQSLRDHPDSQQRPVVVLWDTGGGCESIYRYCKHDGELPRAGCGWVVGAVEEAEAARILPEIKRSSLGHGK